MSKDTKTIARELVSIMEESEVFQNYLKQQELVKDDEELCRKINEIRELNLKLQTEQNSDRIYEEQERLENRFEELCSDPRVYDFIQIESDFIKTYQEINQIVLDKIQFI